MTLKINIWFIITIILAAVLAVILVNNFRQRETTSKQESKEIQVTPTPQAPKISQEELISQIKDITQKSADSDFSISIIDISTSNQLGINDDISQHAASVSKVLTAAYLLKQVEDGKLKLSDPLGAFNVEFQLKQMINQSNNEAWDLIDNLVGFTKQEEFAHSLGLESVDIGDNKMSARDAATLFAKIYNGEIISEQSKNRLLSYMQNTETEYLISPAIPNTTTFYHKSGLFEGEVHDVAIVELNNQSFVLSIFSNNTIVPDYQARGKIIQEITKVVYNFFASG